MMFIKISDKELICWKCQTNVTIIKLCSLCKIGNLFKPCEKRSKQHIHHSFHWVERNPITLYKNNPEKKSSSPPQKKTHIYFELVSLVLSSGWWPLKKTRLFGESLKRITPTKLGLVTALAEQKYAGSINDGLQGKIKVKWFILNMFTYMFCWFCMVSLG